MGQFHPSPHGRIKDLPDYSYDDIDFMTMLDVAKGRRFQGSRSTSEKGYEPSYNQANLYKVEMSEIDKIAESKGDAWLAKLRKMLKMGGGKIYMMEKKGDVAVVGMNHPWGHSMGTMELPMKALRLATILPVQMVEPWTDAYGNPVNPSPLKVPYFRPNEYRNPTVVSEQTQEPLRRRPDYGEIEQEIEKRMSKISSDMLASSFMTKQEMALPEDAYQPVNTQEELFKSAEEAEEQMRVWLEEVSKKLALHHFHQVVYGMPKVDFEGEGPILITGPLKGIERSQEKVMGDYKGDWSKLLDVVRAAIAVDRVDEIGKVLSVLRESGMRLARRPKDRFQTPDETGFRDIHLNIVLPNGHIGEIQIHLKSMLKTREEVHKYYEELREIDAEKEIEGRENYTPEEQITVDEIGKVLSQKYVEALMKADVKIAAEKEGKAIVYLPPTKVMNSENLTSVFLAGSIDMGSAEDWQAEISKALKDVSCVVMNPRRTDWDSSWSQEIENDQFREQVEWELDGMENATLIAMCLTKDSKAPISLLELGLHASEGKMVVCCPTGFWRKGNVDIVCKRYGVPVFEDFDEFKTEVVERMRMPNAIRKGNVASDKISRRMMAREFISGMLKVNVSKKADYRICPVCGESYTSHCRCSGPHSLEDLEKGHGYICKNGHRWSGDIVLETSKVNTKREATMNVKEGDICTVDMGVARAALPKGVPSMHQFRILRDTVKYGDGQVKVVSVRGDDAMVEAVGGGALLGAVQVPIRALKVASKVASTLEKVLAMDDAVLVPRDVVAQICGSCAEKMERQHLTALRASVIKEAFMSFQAKDGMDSITAAVKEFRSTSQVPQLELTKVPDKEKQSSLEERLMKVAKSIAAMPVTDDLGIVLKMLKEDGFKVKVIDENVNSIEIELANENDAYNAVNLLKDEGYTVKQHGPRRLHLTK